MAANLAKYILIDCRATCVDSMLLCVHDHSEVLRSSLPTGETQVQGVTRMLLWQAHRAILDEEEKEVTQLIFTEDQQHLTINPEWMTHLEASVTSSSGTC